jgi:hypothetical protein
MFDAGQQNGSRAREDKRARTSQKNRQFDLQGHEQGFGMLT